MNDPSINLSLKEGVLMIHCKTAFMKQVLPIFLKPTIPIVDDFDDDDSFTDSPQSF